MSQHTIHVVGQPRGAWTVRGEGGTISEHTTVTDAEQAAAAYVRVHGHTEVLVHDRYERVHVSRLTR